MKEEAPLTDEHEVEEPHVYGPKISKITGTVHGERYAFGCDAWIRAKINPAMEMAQKAAKDVPQKSLSELIPMHYHEYLDVFEKKKAERFPDPRP